MKKLLTFAPRFERAEKQRKAGSKKSSLQAVIRKVLKDRNDKKIFKKDLLV